jgi:hypothetical protein
MDKNISSENLHGRCSTEPCAEISKIHEKERKTLQEQNIGPLPRRQIKLY